MVLLLLGNLFIKVCVELGNHLLVRLFKLFDFFGMLGFEFLNLIRGRLAQTRSQCRKFSLMSRLHCPLSFLVIGPYLPRSLT